MSGPEKKVEDYLASECKKLGGIAEKFIAAGRRSVPDRLCQFEQDLIYFVECKAEGKEPTDLQHKDHTARRRRGHSVYVVDSKQSVDRFIAQVRLDIAYGKTIGDSL